LALRKKALTKFVLLINSERQLTNKHSGGYSSAETLTTDANLVLTAVRYKVDASKIAAAVTAELSAKRKGGKSERGSSGGAGNKRRSSNA
jgi:hypothetical protein